MDPEVALNIGIGEFDLIAGRLRKTENISKLLATLIFVSCSWKASQSQNSCANHRLRFGSEYFTSLEIDALTKSLEGVLCTVCVFSRNLRGGNCWQQRARRASANKNAKAHHPWSRAPCFGHIPRRRRRVILGRVFFRVKNSLFLLKEEHIYERSAIKMGRRVLKSLSFSISLLLPYLPFFKRL